MSFIGMPLIAPFITSPRTASRGAKALRRALSCIGPSGLMTPWIGPSAAPAPVTLPVTFVPVCCRCIVTFRYSPTEPPVHVPVTLAGPVALALAQPASVVANSDPRTSSLILFSICVLPWIAPDTHGAARRRATTGPTAASGGPFGPRSGSSRDVFGERATTGSGAYVRRCALSMSGPTTTPRRDQPPRRARSLRRRTNDTLPLPATKTWQPSRHVRAVRLVLRTEGRPQLGLLVDEDGEVEDEDPDRRVPEEDDVPEEQRLSDDDRREGHVNRVPHVPVHASHHEVTRRGHGCGRPQP